MAEERICITKLGPNPSDCFLIDNTCDGMCVNCTQGMTRQEAIERMAKAMCRRDYRISCDKCIYKNSKNCKTTLENWFIEDAEAALNAIAPMIPQEEE